MERVVLLDKGKVVIDKCSLEGTRERVMTPEGTWRLGRVALARAAW